MWAAFFAYIFAFSFRPPDRVIFVPMFVLQLSYSLFSMLMGSLIKAYTKVEYHRLVNTFLMTGISVLSIVLPLRIAISQIDLLPSFRLYGQLWDLRDETLRKASANGISNVEVLCFRNMPEFKDLRSTIWMIGDFEDANNWKNLGAAEYYGLQSITCKRNEKLP
jgi:hypothetical protein